MGGISVFILMAILSFMFFTFVAIFLAIVVYTAITYIFESIAVMSMSKNLGYKAIYTSWIPFYNKYLLGKIAENKVLGIILALLNIITTGIGIFCYVRNEFNPITFLLFLICVLIGFILDTIISHKIYIKAINKYGDILTIFSVLTLGLLRPIFLFIIRNKKLDIKV